MGDDTYGKITSSWAADGPPRPMEMGYPRATPARADGDAFWHRESADKLPQEPPAPCTGAREPVEQSRAQDAPARAGAISHAGGHAMDLILKRVAGLDIQIVPMRWDSRTRTFSDRLWLACHRWIESGTDRGPRWRPRAAGRSC
jgi:hypothetical protein